MQKWFRQRSCVTRVISRSFDSWVLENGLLKSLRIAWSIPKLHRNCLLRSFSLVSKHKNLDCFSVIAPQKAPAKYLLRLLIECADWAPTYLTKNQKPSTPASLRWSAPEHFTDLCKNIIAVTGWDSVNLRSHWTEQLIESMRDKGTLSFCDTEYFLPFS